MNSLIVTCHSHKKDDYRNVQPTFVEINTLLPPIMACMSCLSKDVIQKKLHGFCPVKEACTGRKLLAEFADELDVLCGAANIQFAGTAKICVHLCKSAAKKRAFSLQPSAISDQVC